MAKNLEIYIHIPFCLHKCDYCDFLSFVSDSRTQAQYVHAMMDEIRFYGSRLGGYKVSTIYIGGGTPSWIEANLIAALLDKVYSCFSVAKDAEVSIECNPGTVTNEKLKQYAMAGINRLSIGMQSASDVELKLLGRVHNYEQFLKMYEMARNAGFYNVSVDIMSALPYQTAEKFSDTLQKVIRLRPEHISAYSLSIEKGTPFYDRYKFDAVRQEAGLKTEVLPDEDEVYRIYKLTQRVLVKSGFNQYEISNYAKPGYECRHNIGYWTRENYLGLGIGAASMVDNVRYTNTRDIYSYINGCKSITELPPDEFASHDRRSEAQEPVKKETPKTWIGTNLHTEADILTRKAQMEEFMFLGLRMPAGVERARFEESFSMPIDAIYRDVIEDLRAKGLLVAEAGRIRLTEKGLDLSNYCMAKFLL